MRGSRAIDCKSLRKQAADFARDLFDGERVRGRIEIVPVPNAGQRQMNGYPLSFSIYNRLPLRRETPAVIGAKFLDSLDALSRIDPLFSDWEVLDRPTWASLPLARTRIATIIENNVARDSDGRPKPESGYSAIGETNNAILSRIVTLTIQAGGVMMDEMTLRVRNILYPGDPLIVKYSGLFREAFLATSAIWGPTWATVAAHWMDYWKKPIVPGAPLFPHTLFHIPWIVYLSPALAMRFPLPPEISTRRMPDGALLLTATEEPFNPTSPEHLRRALILAEAMMARAEEGATDTYSP
jgi:hypothetical protein